MWMDKEVQVGLKSPDLFRYPLLYINGHGNISFDDTEVERLREFLNRGGFLHADDNYGMDKSFPARDEKSIPGE